MLSGISGNYSGHPIRTRSVLEDAAGTVRAVFIWSVNRCLAVAAISRCQPGGVLGIELERWGSHGLVAIRGPSGRLPIWSVGVLWPTAPAGFLPAVALDRARLRVSRFGQPGGCCRRCLHGCSPFEGGGPWSRVADPGV